MACREAGKVSGELASEPGAQVRQLVSELALALLPSQSRELWCGGWAVFPSKSLHLFSSEGKMIPEQRRKACCGRSCWSGWHGAGIGWESWASLAGAGYPLYSGHNAGM